jgi:hypothetical protein
MQRVTRLTLTLIMLVTGVSVVVASDARSAGYWIRWSTCGGGVGADSATVHHTGSGPERVLLDDLLATPGIVWDDRQDDELVVRIGTCEQAVAVLKAGVGDVDAVSLLARELLTAQLNLMAGVAGCPDVEHAMILAEDLLDTLDFNPEAPRAETEVMSSRSDASEAYSQPARELAAELRRFNLGGGCTGPTDDVERGGS